MVAEPPEDLLSFAIHNNSRGHETQALDGRPRKSVLRVIPSLFACIPWLRLLLFRHYDR